MQIGSEAVRLAGEGITCVMLTFRRLSGSPYQIGIGYTNVENVANKVRFVDDGMIERDGNRVTDACCRYIAPLIAGELHSFFEGGLPRHIVF